MPFSTKYLVPTILGISLSIAIPSIASQTPDRVPPVVQQTVNTAQNSAQDAVGQVQGQVNGAINTVQQTTNNSWFQGALNFLGLGNIFQVFNDALQQVSAFVNQPFLKDPIVVNAPVGDNGIAAIESVKQNAAQAAQNSFKLSDGLRGQVEGQILSDYTDRMAAQMGQYAQTQAGQKDAAKLRQGTAEILKQSSASVEISNGAESTYDRIQETNEQLDRVTQNLATQNLLSRQQYELDSAKTAAEAQDRLTERIKNQADRINQAHEQRANSQNAFGQVMTGPVFSGVKK